jgi:hypothetical protein
MEVWKLGGEGLTTIKHESSLAIYVMKTIKKKMIIVLFSWFELSLVVRSQ